MSQNNVNIGALIGSRICHDLISPIGAINNGLELLSMSDERDGPEFDLITESVGNASARIRFFRIAYGAASDQPMGRAEVTSIIEGVAGTGRLKIAYGPMNEQPRWAVRLAFLAVQCLETSMPFGGRIEVACDNGAWSISGHATKTNVDKELWAWLDGKEGKDLAPAHVQFALLAAVTNDAKRRLETKIEAELLEIKF